MTNDDKILALRRIEDLDVDAGLKVIAGMIPVYLRLLRLFVKNHERDKDLLDNQLAADDLRGFRVSIHGYKSSLGNLGALGYSEMALALEKAAMDNDREFIDREFDEFKKSIAEFAQSLRAVLGE
jgi:HPt (histidine-containing phosphotransfer) domain-containing protein